MNLVNNVTLIGKLGADPKVKEFGEGQMVANFSVATTEYYKVKDEFKEKVYWHNIVAWGKDAKKVKEKCVKGTEVVLNGKLTSRSYDDKNGEKRWVYEVVVNEIICRSKAA
ncbi:MAG: single-stranded DNA-binding protein [Bacteroidales bacterium]|jgi:single-strand DNA-binding protein|nr:single-stranded DNA-binding protein [Bacteroidales bacterium]